MCDRGMEPTDWRVLSIESNRMRLVRVREHPRLDAPKRRSPREGSLHLFAGLRDGPSVRWEESRRFGCF